SAHRVRRRDRSSRSWRREDPTLQQSYRPHARRPWACPRAVMRPPSPAESADQAPEPDPYASTSRSLLAPESALAVPALHLCLTDPLIYLSGCRIVVG